MPIVHKRTAAWQDLLEHYTYLAENASLHIAERFLNNVEISFIDLSEKPMMGSPLTLRHPKLIGIRKWQVKEFDNILIFYQPRQGGISVVRVLHTAQDWWGILNA